MTDTIVPYRFACRRRSAASWASINEVLLLAEIGVETDTRKFKFGNGSTPWNSLPYVGELANLAAPASDKLVLFDAGLGAYVHVGIGGGLIVDSSGDLVATGGGGTAGTLPFKWSHIDQSGCTLSNSLLSAALSGGGWRSIRCNRWIEGDGFWYWEVVLTASSGADQMIGISKTTLNVLSQFTGQTSDSYGYYGSSGVKYNNNSGSAYGSSYTTGDVIGIAFKVVAGSGSLWFSKNNTWQNSGNPDAGTNAAFTGIAANAWFPTSSSNSGGTHTLRAKAASFTGTKPTGATALDPST